MTLRELASEPTPEQFQRIAIAIKPDARVIGTRQLTGGVSCRMDVLKLESSAAGQFDVVVRQYGPWHKDDDPHPGQVEAAILAKLSESDIPAPGLVLGEQATSILGTPAIVTTFVPGSPMVQPVNLESWSNQITDSLVRIHGLVLPESLISLIPSVYSRYERKLVTSEPNDRIARHPLGLELWKKMKAMWPSVEKPTSKLIHGDFWAGNMVWEGESLSAIVDWEEPRLGTPVYDIAIFVQDAEFFGLDIEESILTRYTEKSQLRLRDYNFWKMARLLDAMPDPGEWSEDFVAMGGSPITANEVRANHNAAIERLLADS